MGRYQYKRRLLSLHLHIMSCSAILLKKRFLRQKEWWVHPTWQRRNTHGAYNSLVKSLAEEDPVYFKKYLRMTPKEFDHIKNILEPYLKKCPAGRKALSVGHRLAITIRYLESGDSMASIAFAFRVGFSTVNLIVSEVCDALWDGLGKLYLPIPNLERWAEIESGFWSQWQFPNCVGVVDGKHVQIQSPAKSGSAFYNYKGHFSTILMAIVDSNYKFVVADVGVYGSNSDGGVWKSSQFSKAFDAGKVEIPQAKIFPNSKTLMSHVLLEDEAFQLRSNFTLPFPGKQLNDSRRIFNYPLSRARRCVENAFGIITARWRIFRRPILMKPENVDRVVKACIVLHNYLKVEAEKSQTSVYCPLGFADRNDSNGVLAEGDWRREVCLKKSAFGQIFTTSAAKNFTLEAFSNREAFVDYFSTYGSVPWQAESAGVHEIYLN